MIQTKFSSHEVPSNWFDRLCRSLIIRQFGQVVGGVVRLRDSDGEWVLGQLAPLNSPAIGSPAAGDAGEEIVLHVNHPRFYRRLLRGGSLGAAEALMDGDWSSPQLTSLVRLLIRNLDRLDRLDRGWAWFRRGWERWVHWLRRNTARGSRKNISEHYDLGNDFFSLFLDPTMNYSSAVFESLEPTEHPESLHRAQLRKMHRLCELLQLKPTDHLLEIGSGWGSLACYAAKHFGCRVTTTTISREQFAWTKQRIAHEGLGDRVTALEQDYRQLTGRYDKIISVEMIEAVGDQFYDTFFRQCQALLKPQGLMLLQAITIVDQRYADHLRSVDFICKYIFPGGSLPCISRLVQSAAAAAQMRLVALDDYAAHYAETLRRWRVRFQQQLETVRGQGFDERFIRMWDYYLAYCEAAFDERQINLAHLLFAPRECRWDVTEQRPIEFGTSVPAETIETTPGASAETPAPARDRWRQGPRS